MIDAALHPLMWLQPLDALELVMLVILYKLQ
jgi:hypothetical protein